MFIQRLSEDDKLNKYWNNLSVECNWYKLFDCRLSRVYLIYRQKTKKI